MTPVSSKHSLFYILYDIPEVYSNMAPEKLVVGRTILSYCRAPSNFSKLASFAGTVHVMQCKSGGYLDGGKGDRFVSEEVVDEAGRCDISKTGCHGRCCFFFFRCGGLIWGLFLGVKWDAPLKFEWMDTENDEYIYIYIPRAPTDLYFWRSSSPKTRPNFQSKTRGPIWVLGTCPSFSLRGSRHSSCEAHRWSWSTPELPELSGVSRVPVVGGDCWTSGGGWLWMCCCWEIHQIIDNRYILHI